MTETPDDERKCCFNAEKFWLSGAMEKGCQFTNEVELFDVDGRKYCRFHMPLFDRDRRPTSKSTWDNSQFKLFDDGIESLLSKAMDAKDPNSEDWWAVADLSGVVFPRYYNFTVWAKHRARFGPFEDGTSGNADFLIPNIFADHAYFAGGVDFSDLTFSGNVSFTNTIFKLNANFAGTTFGGSYTSFIGAKFCSGVNFSALQNTPPFRRIDFRRCNFAGDYPYEVIVDNPPIISFNNRRFVDETYFDRAIFNVAPKFYGVSFHQGCNISAADFKQSRLPDAPFAYRALKQAMEERHDWNSMAKFHALEERSLRYQSGTPWHVKLVSLAYDIASEYGQNLLRPLAGLGGVFYFSFLLYCGVLVCAGEKGNVDVLVEVLKFDLMQMVKPFHAIVSDWQINGFGPWVRFFFGIIATLQTLATAGFVTLFILAVRRRFRMA